MKKEFKKSDLRTGMQVEARDKTRYVVLLDTMAGDVIVSKHGYWGRLDDRNDDLISTYDRDFDIMRVFENEYPGYYIDVRMSGDSLIWQRQEDTLEVTVKFNGKEVSPKEISEETWNNLRK